MVKAISSSSSIGSSIIATLLGPCRSERHLTGRHTSAAVQAHQRLGYVSSLRDVFAVFLVGHADPLLRHHLPER